MRPAWRSRGDTAYTAVKKLLPESHAAHSKVRSSVFAPLGSINVNFIGLPHVGHGNSVA
jgi:hypothetical protein